jgi:hypothetical protein
MGADQSCTNEATESHRVIDAKHEQVEVKPSLPRLADRRALI